MTLTEAAELAVVLSRNLKPGQEHPLHWIARDVAKLRRCATRAMTRSVRLCNEGDYDSFERDKASILKGTTEIAKTYNVTKIDIGGDPRGGSCLTLHFADGSSNRFDKEGWSI